jgi:hypothetical protein
MGVSHRERDIGEICRCRDLKWDRSLDPKGRVSRERRKERVVGGEVQEVRVWGQNTQDLVGQIKMLAFPLCEIGTNEKFK